VFPATNGAIGSGSVGAGGSKQGNYRNMEALLRIGTMNMSQNVAKQQ